MGEIWGRYAERCGEMRSYGGDKGDMRRDAEIWGRDAKIWGVLVRVHVAHEICGDMGEIWGRYGAYM